MEEIKIEDSSQTVFKEVAITPTYVCELERKIISKEKEMEKKEKGVTMMVGIILATFFICTTPAAIVLETDPEAEKYSWVPFKVL